LAVYLGLALIAVLARLSGSGKFDPSVFVSVWPVAAFTALAVFGFALTGSILVRSRFRREHFSQVDDAAFLDQEFRKRYRGRGARRKGKRRTR
ncbi:MAG: hypothetical protein V2I43_16575, partial [Parvularcula sp.]|nr:hypothetical protein [Parvularcula sp.]